MKRNKLLVLLIALMLCIPSAFATEAVKAEEATTVTILVPSDHLDIMEILFEDFHSKNSSIKVEIDATSSGWDGVATKLVTMLAGGQPVDIAAVSTSYYPQFIELNQLMDITEHAKENYSDEEYYWSVFEGLMVQDKLYGVPISIYTLVNYYNKDIYAENGVDPPELVWGEEAWSFEDWQEVARELSSGEGLDRIYGAWIDYQLERTAAFLFPKGLNYWADDLTPQFDNQEIRDIHEELYTMLHEENLMPDADMVDTTGLTQLFGEGKVANYIEGSWAHHQIFESGVNFGVAPTPGGTTVGYVDVYIPLASTKNPVATQTVLDYLISYDACVIKYENNRLGPQVNRKASEDSLENSFGGLEKEEVEFIFDSLNHSIPLTVFPKWGEFLSDSLLPTSSLMEIGEYTVDEGFDFLQQQANTLLGR